MIALPLTNRLLVSAPVIDLDQPSHHPGFRPLPADQQIRSRARGEWVYNPNELATYVHPSQTRKVAGGTFGNDLRFALEGRPVMREALIDFLERNQVLWPDAWKCDIMVVAWGDVFESSDDGLNVRAAGWVGRRVFATFIPLHESFDAQRAAAERRF